MGQLSRGNQGELVEEALGILHEADHGFAPLRPGVTDLEVELRRQAGRERDLVRALGVVTGEQLEHRRSEGAVRILRPELVRLAGTGDTERLILHDLYPTNVPLERCDVCLGVRQAL